VTLNDLERRNGHYFAEFGSFCGQLRKSIWFISHQQIFSPEMSVLTKHDGRAVLFAIAELLVYNSVDVSVFSYVNMFRVSI